MRELPHKRAHVEAGPAAAAAARAVPQLTTTHTGSASSPGPAGTSTGSGSSTAPPHTRLHRHALESIFAFFAFRPVRSVMFVSRDWLAAVCFMRGVGHTVTDPERVPGGLQSLLRSRLARHVTSLGDTPHPESPLFLRISPPLLRQIRAAMPYLTTLVCIPMNGEEWRGAFQLPSTLSDLTLYLPDGMDDGSVNELLAEVGSHQCIQKVHLGCDTDEAEQPQRMGARVDISPLATMPALRVLVIGDAGDVSDEQVAQLRSLTQLTRLEVTPCPHLLLARLLAPGHQLGWTELGNGMVVDDISAPLLAPLPYLSSLVSTQDDGAVLNVSRLDCLVPITQLTHLELDLHSYAFEEELQRSLLTLPLHFPHLAIFILEHASLSSADLSIRRLLSLSRIPVKELEA